MPEVEASEVKVCQILRALRQWKEGPRGPSDARFDATLELLIERLEELKIGDNDWDQIDD